jgi:selenophosphate synthetase-related protein
VKVTGYLDGEADDGDTNSLQVIGEIGLAVVKDGNNYMVLTSEGAHRKVEAEGWGIGFYTTGGIISDSGKASGIMGGGTGYAQNETGPEDRPWIQGYFGVKEVQVETEKQVKTSMEQIQEQQQNEIVSSDNFDEQELKLVELTDMETMVFYGVNKEPTKKPIKESTSYSYNNIGQH